MVGKPYDGPREFTFILDDSKRGQTGTYFEFIELEEGVGKEAVLIFLEEPNYASIYKGIKGIRLESKQIVLNTDHGPVVIVLWKLAAATEYELVVEHYLSPEFFENEDGRIIEKQPHLRVIVLDNQTGRSRGFFQFDNVYDFHELGNKIRALHLPKMGKKMLLARQSIEQDMSIKDLRRLASF